MQQSTDKLPDDAKVVTCRIDYPKTMFDGAAKVMATVEGVEGERLLFSFFHDELSFSEDELKGLTVKAARELRHKRDVEYLRS